MEYIKSAVRLFLVYVLMFTSLFIGVGMKVVDAKGTVGEYADAVNVNTAYLNPNDSSKLDQVGTRWNMVDDLYTRMFNKHIGINFNALVTVSSANANNQYYEDVSSQTYNTDRLFNYRGWTIAVPTGTVSSERTRVRIYNPTTNTQRVRINVATGTVSALLYYPSTGSYLAEITPGNGYEMDISSAIHPVLQSSGNITTERVNVTEYK